MKHIEECFREKGWRLWTFGMMAFFGVAVGVGSGSVIAGVILSLVVFGCSLLIGHSGNSENFKK